MELFDRKEWTISTLINDVKQKRLTRSQAVWYANLYYGKGYFDESDMERIAAATADPEPVAEEIAEETAE